ncbi:hypothetical protein Hdeb2414_s0008g00276541 [Helianthus debilis subsp. tardiflorus]
MMGAVLLHTSSMHIDVYTSLFLGYAREGKKDRTRGRKASSPSSSQTFHQRVSEGTLDENTVFM